MKLMTLCIFIMNGKFSGECTFFCIYLFIIRGKKYPHPTTCFTQFTITHNIYLHLSYYFIVLLQTYRFVLVFDMLRRYHIKLKWKKCSLKYPPGEFRPPICWWWLNHTKRLDIVLVKVTTHFFFYDLTIDCFLNTIYFYANTTFQLDPVSKNKNI